MTEVFLLWAFVAAADGDTLTIRDGDTKTVIRLAEIDAPERTQPYSQVSRRNLEALCRNAKSVELAPVDTDRYGRTVAHVWCDGVHVNWRQVEDGLAWCFTQYLKQSDVCLPLEKAAREARRGLWHRTQPAASLGFRAAKRGERSP
jgi:endonuclease YncB( thermonuclease family)